MSTGDPQSNNSSTADSLTETEKTDDSQELNKSETESSQANEESQKSEIKEDIYSVFKPEDWPQELDFRTLFEPLEPSQYPDSYHKNTKKEERLHNFLISFREQFKYKFKDRKIPFLLPINECEVNKFVCTYINPVKLEHCEVYDWQGIANFVADFLHYAPLIPATEYPARLLSPFTVLKMQKATTFEYSTVLCCLLIGAGYDAYIISGYATRETCYADRKLDKCPFIDIQEETVSDDTKKRQKIYSIKPAKDYRSRFELFLAARKVLDEKDGIEQEKLKKLEQERIEDIPPPDRLFGMRIHSWILVKAGKRLIEESFFIEPTTGIRHPLKGQKIYNGIEAAWNNENYWCNMQDCTNGVDNLYYDFDDENFWEHILSYDLEGDLKIGDSSNRKFLNRVSFEDINDGDMHQMKMNLLKEEHDIAMKRPDMTASWTIPMKIDRRTFESKYPKFQKRIHYKRVIVDHYAEHFLADGLVMRMQIYSDREYEDLLETHELYKHRQDKLLKKILDVKTGWVKEFFAAGRGFQITTHVYLQQSPEPENERNLLYNHHIRADGLQTRKETENSLTEYYANRPDRLCYRHADFDPIPPEDEEENIENEENRSIIKGQEEDTAKKESKISFKTADSSEGPPKKVTRKINRIVQRYTRNPDISADEDIEEEMFLINEGKIQLKYHRDNPCITTCTREFIKPFIPEDQIQKLQLRDETHYAYTVDQYKCPLKKVQIYQLMLDLYDREEKAIDEIRWAENETLNIWRQRNTEEEELKLDISMFDCLRNDETKERRAEMIRMEEEEKERSRQLSLDYLAPFLAQIGFIKNLTWEQACTLREDCLDDFKQRLIDKANLIHERLSKETKILQQKQQWYMENRMDMSEEDEENYVNFCNNSAFLITTLQLMLSRHKQSAPLKYIELEKRIRKDKRLAILFNNKNI